MFMFIAAALVQTSGMATSASAEETAILTLEEPSSTGIGATPRIVAVPAPMLQQPMRVTVPVTVRVSAGNRLLFNGTLRVAEGSGAGYSENRNEASLTPCPGRPYEATERSSLSVQLYLRENQATGQAVNVSVNWQRPAPGGTCGNDGTRSVQLGQTVQLQPGQSTTIAGDAGLLVTLTRR